jgi:hypothetical protein
MRWNFLGRGLLEDSHKVNTYVSGEKEVTEVVGGAELLCNCHKTISIHRGPWNQNSAEKVHLEVIGSGPHLPACFSPHVWSITLQLRAVPREGRI